MRSGALGTIIDGMTRDYSAVKNLNFPVFSRGYTCQDVLKKATVESINKSIKIQNIPIYPGELIFADNDGIAVIPIKYEDIILKRAFEVIKKESAVIAEIVSGTDAIKIFEKIGDF